MEKQKAVGEKTRLNPRHGSAKAEECGVKEIRSREMERARGSKRVTGAVEGCWSELEGGGRREKKKVFSKERKKMSVASTNEISPIRNWVKKC